MAIVKSVGEKGVSQQVDVKLIQVALNLVETTEFAMTKNSPSMAKSGQIPIRRLSNFKRRLSVYLILMGV